MSKPESNLGSKKDVALLEWIHQFAPYGVITLDKSLRIQSWNRWMETHSGMRLEEVTGKTLIELFPEINQRKIVPVLERALEGQPTVLSTSLHRYILPLPSPLHKIGREKMLQTARVAPLTADDAVCGVVVMIEDVTQREHQAGILREQHRRDDVLAWALAHLLKTEQPRKAVRQIFFKIAENLDFDTFCLYLREVETSQLKLYTSGGLTCDLEKEFSRHALLLNVAESGETMVLNSVGARSEPEFDLLKRAGLKAAVVLPLNVENRSLGLLCFATWSREFIAQEESSFLKTLAQYLAIAVERENTNMQLRTAKAALYDHSLLLERRVEERTSQLQQSVAEIETFSYTLAHDLKAPVRGLTGYCQVLLEDFNEKLPPNASLIVEKMKRTSQRMQTLIRDLLEFSRISREEVALGRVELEPIIDDLIAMRDPAVRNAITVSTPLHPVKANCALLQQVISNLVDNAVKFVAPGKLAEITVCTQPVAGKSPSTRSGKLVFSSSGTSGQAVDGSSSSEPRDEYVRIWVSDHGIGIPSEAHQKIFSIFERGTASELYEGTGIGLAIVARATQRMGGSCGVESGLGQGSRFWIELPAAS